MWIKSLEVLNPYEAIVAALEAQKGGRADGR